jgi:hypothetical protein
LKLELEEVVEICINQVEALGQKLLRENVLPSSGYWPEVTGQTLEHFIDDLSKNKNSFLLWGVAQRAILNFTPGPQG